MNAKAEQKERSHEGILQSAARLIREKGISGARVADVMKGAGLTVGGFYAHFPSKEALIDATLRDTSLALRESLFANLDQKPEADRAVVILKRYLSPFHRDQTEAGCSLPSVIGEVGTTAPEHSDVLAEQIEKMTSKLEEHLAPTPAISKRHLAVGLVALMVGGLSLSRALRGTAWSDEVLKACRALGKIAVSREPATKKT